MIDVSRNRYELTAGCWIKCPDCDDAFCTVHNKHTWECDCPSIEVWADEGMDPYSSETGAT